MWLAAKVLKMEVEEAAGADMNIQPPLRERRTARFGEYYLGNTLGEGEFGKVKMGWKQEGGVQVSKHDI